MTDRRMIAAAIWEDEFVGSLTFFERLLWIGLIVACADDQGRMTDNVNVIRSKVFMFDDNVTSAKIEEAIQKIITAGKLAKYSDEKGRGYFQLVNWWKYQSLQWPQPSRFPRPPGWVDRVRYHSTNRKIVTENWDMQGGYCQDIGLDSSLPTGLGRSLGRDQARAIEEEDDEEDREEEIERAAEGGLLPGQSVYPEWPRIPDAMTAERVFQQVTQMATFPGRSRSSDVERICAIYDHHREKTVEYLQKYWQAWLGRGYNRVNTGWLDWALSGQVPNRSNGSTPRKPAGPDPEIGTDDPTVVSAYYYLKLNPKGSPGMREGAMKRLKEKGYDYVDGRLIKLENPA